MILQAADLVARIPELAEIAEIIAVPFAAVPSPNIYFPEWQGLVRLCDQLVADHPDLAGIIIGHGTASMEKTAYMLNLTTKIAIPIVVVWSQRPTIALSTDANMNLLNAVRVAAAPQSRGLGVLVLLNDEIHAAREVTTTSTLRLQTFRTPDFGVLGHADGDAIAYYRRPIRKVAPDTEFDIRTLAGLLRVDIAYSYSYSYSYSYAGAVGTAARAFIAAGARAIVSAGFAPGFAGPGDFGALEEAVAKSIVVMQCTRACRGRTFKGTRLRDAGFLISDNLNPQKARLRLALTLTVTSDPTEIERIFLTY